MKSNQLLASPYLLLAGDVLALAGVTIIGFANHGELDTAGVRMLTTFLPLVVSWLIMAPLVGAFNVDHARQLPDLWRPAAAAVLAMPWFGFLRSLLLWRAVLPIVTLVIGGVALAALLIWRILYLILARGVAPRGQLLHE